MSEPTAKLRRRADALLRDFPMSEPDFEAQARSIEARVAMEVVSSHHEDMLAVPALPAAPGEPATASSVRASPAPKSSFAEMARRSLHRPDSDSAELTKELLAATAQSRRPTPEMVARVRAAGRAAAVVTPLPASAESSLLRSDPPEEAPRTSRVVQRLPQGRSPRTLWLAVIGGALALAAGVALFVSSSASNAPGASALLEAERAAGREGQRGEPPLGARPDAYAYPSRPNAGGADCGASAAARPVRARRQGLRSFRQHARCWASGGGRRHPERGRLREA
jgi:hypothetical protein